MVIYWSRFRKGNGLLWKRNSPQGIWDHIAEKMRVELAESGHFIFLATTPIVQGYSQKQRTQKIVDSLWCISRNNWDFFTSFFLQTSSVSTEQSQTCVKKMNPFTIDQGHLIWWWDNHLSSVKSRQKSLWRMMTQHIKTFYCSDMKSQLKGFQQIK